MFKNLQIYQIDKPFPLSLEDLESKLSQAVFAPCQPNQPSSQGWFPPRANPNLPLPTGAYPFVQNVGGQWALRLVREDKIIPGAVIRRHFDARSAELQAQRGYPPGRKEAKELKERIAAELLPNTQPKRRLLDIWIDPVDGWLAIDASSRSGADVVLELLRHSLEALPVKAIHTTLSPSVAMAVWLTRGEAPAGFTLDRDCELKSPAEEKSTVRYVRHALTDDQVLEQIREHLSAGKLPTRLALTWDERISFILTEKLELKRLAFLDLATQAESREASDAEDIADGDFALSTGEARRLLSAVIQALGGFVET